MKGNSTFVGKEIGRPRTGERSATADINVARRTDDDAIRVYLGDDGSGPVWSAIKLGLIGGEKIHPGNSFDACYIQWYLWTEGS